jgi:hypothetical protein
VTGFDKKFFGFDSSEFCVGKVATTVSTTLHSIVATLEGLLGVLAFEV